MPGSTEAVLAAIVAATMSGSLAAQEMSVARIACSGNEPFWHFEVGVEEGVLTRPTADGVVERRYVGQMTWLDWLHPGWQVWRGHAEDDPADVLVATLRVERCLDSMAGEEAGAFDFVALLSMADMPAVNGCCRMAPPADAMDQPVAADLTDPTAVYDRRWLLENIAGAGVIDSLEIPMQFNPIGTVSGHAGCNRFSGAAALGAGTLDVGPLATTRRACTTAVMDQEQRFLDALARASAWRIGDDGLLRLADAAGNELLRFAPAN
jgi:heat shock protein HslJ